MTRYLKQMQPHLIAIGIFLIVAVLFCRPVLQGLVVNQPDLMQYKAMAQDGFNYKEKHGDFPEWTNSMFGGMPAYAIAFDNNAAIAPYLTGLLTLGLPEPMAYFFLCCITFYFLSQVLRVNPWIGIMGALAFAYSSYNPIIIVTGHHTKMMAIAYMPGLIAALLLIFEHRKYLLGAALTAIFTSALVAYNHLQMVYYILLVILCMGVCYAVVWFRQKDFAHFAKAAGLGLIAGVLGVLSTATGLFTTYDYAPETMRGGKANLDASFSGDSTNTSTKGLDIDYAFRWSYGIAETLTMLVPNANGGASEGLGEESNFYQTLIEKYNTRQIDQNLAQVVQRFGSAYWGNQPFTSGPVYTGALIFLLAIIGIVFAEKKYTVWMVAASVIGIVLAWGSNFMAINEFLFNYLPLYNKFRAPAQSLVMPQLLLPALAVLGLQALFSGGQTADEKLKKIKAAGIAMGAVLLLAVLYYFSAGYKSENELEMVKQIAQQSPEASAQAKEVLNAAAEDRKGMFGADLFRTVALVAIGFGLIFLAIREKIKPGLLFILFTALVLIDALPVAARFLPQEAYVEAENSEITNYIASANPQLFKVLQGIEADKDPNFRVFNTASDPFNDALTSAKARSVGGYHPAKLSIYQDLIEHQLSKQNMNVFNMLNTRYFIVNGSNGLEYQQNPGAFGAAWLATEIMYVKDANEEMRALDSTDIRNIAIVQESFKSNITNAPVFDSTASIQLTVYDNDLLEYKVNAPTPQFAVLSEIYYARGWKAYANDKEVPIVKTNYVLRGVALPAGTTSLRLEFKPDSFAMGRRVTNISEAIILVMLLAAIVPAILRMRRQAK
jgi:hypothetical protein